MSAITPIWRTEFTAGRLPGIVQGNSIVWPLKSLARASSDEFAAYSDGQLTLLLDFFSRAEALMQRETAKLKSAAGHRKQATRARTRSGRDRS